MAAASTRGPFSFGDIWGLQWYGGISLFASLYSDRSCMLFFGFGDFMDDARAPCFCFWVEFARYVEATFQRRE